MTDGLARHFDQVTVWDVFDRRGDSIHIARTSRGDPYVRWMPDGMPKLGKYQCLMKSVFFLYTFVTDYEAFSQCRDVRMRYLGAATPTSTTIEISRLAQPEAMVEIELVAVVE